MTKESLIGISKKLVFRETFNSEFDTRKNGGVPSNVIYENGSIVLNGTNSNLIYPNVNLNGYYSVRIVFRDAFLPDTSQYVFDLRDGIGYCHLTNTGGIVKSSGTHYFQGEAISTTPAYKEIVISNILLKNKSITFFSRSTSYSNFLKANVELIEIYQGKLTAEEVKLLYNNKTYQKPIITETIKNNIINNGTFDTDTNWNKGPGWTISGGRANANTSSISELSQGSVLTIGKTYRITYDVVEYTSGSVEFYNSTGVPIIQRYATGTYSQDFTATGVSVYFTARSNFVGAIDNVVVREITPSLLLDFDSSNNQLIERTGKSISASNVILARTGKYTGAYFNNTSTLTFTGGGYPQTDSTTLIWFNADDYGTKLGTEFLGAKIITDLGNFYLAIRENKKTYRCTNGGGYLIGSDNMVYLKRWTFLAVVRKTDKTLKVYVGNLDKAPFLADTYVDIGTIGVSTGIRLGTKYKGLIKMAQVYSGELGLAEITQVYTSTKEKVV